MADGLSHGQRLRINAKPSNLAIGRVWVAGLSLLLAEAHAKALETKDAIRATARGSRHSSTRQRR